MDPMDISFYLERLEPEYKSVMPQCSKMHSKHWNRQNMTTKDHSVLSRGHCKVWSAQSEPTMTKCTVVPTNYHSDVFVVDIL